MRFMWCSFSAIEASDCCCSFPSALIPMPVPVCQSEMDEALTRIPESPPEVADGSETRTGSGKDGVGAD